MLYMVHVFWDSTPKNVPLESQQWLSLRSLLNTIISWSWMGRPHDLTDLCPTISPWDKSWRNMWGQNVFLTEAPPAMPLATCSTPPIFAVCDLKPAHRKAPLLVVVLTLDSTAMDSCGRNGLKSARPTPGQSPQKGASHLRWDYPEPMDLERLARIYRSRPCSIQIIPL